MDKFVPQAKQMLQRAHKKYQSLDTYPPLSKLVISDIIRPSNIAIVLSAILALIVLIIAPFSIPFVVICFLFPLRATKEYFKNQRTNQWIIFYWILNATQQVLTPFVCIVLPYYLWIIIRIAVAYYLVVMGGGNTLYPLIKQYLKIKQTELRNVNSNGEVKQE